MIDCLIIPDVHGRDFWRDAIPYIEEGKTDIIFLGDYVDPYPSEKISQDKAFETLLEIIDLKKKYTERITLLLGNHDLGYINPEICMCRHDFLNGQKITDTLFENKDCFEIICEKEYNGIEYIFSHAGITKEWEKMVSEEFIYEMNNIWHSGKNSDRFPELEAKLSIVGYSRGGWYKTGSVVWADLRESAYDPAYQNKRQIFGHTMMKTPYIHKLMSCVDNQHIWKLENGELTELKKNINL